MKWAVVGLCLLGITAAMCAAFLVNSLRASGAVVTVAPTTQEAQAMVQVLYATTGLPAMTVVDAKSVVVKSVPKNLVPKDYLSSPVDVVGKVVGVPVVEGQAFTTSCFADKETARQVADAIPFGKRAVGISVTDYAGLEGMLFPGSTVDVMVSFKPQEGEWQNAVTGTLLENIQVLGIEHQTVVSPNKPAGDANYNIGRNGARRVTLLVNTEQAKKLQLAMGYGTLSLALRNPLDASKNDDKSLSVEKLLADMAPFRIFEKKPPAPVVVEPAPAPAPVPVVIAPTTKPVEPPPVPQWEVTVIRGTAQETKSFPMPKAINNKIEAANAAPAH